MLKKREGEGEGEEKSDWVMEKEIHQKMEVVEVEQDWEGVLRTDRKSVKQKV